MSWGPPDQGPERPGSSQWGSYPPPPADPASQQGWQQQGGWQQPPPPPGGWQQGGWQQPPPPPGGWQQPPPPPGGWQQQGGWQQPPPPPDQGAAWWGGQPPVPDYPVNISFVRRARINRFWGIPLLNWLLRAIALIPHVIVLCLVAIVVAIISLFTWIGVLVNGRFPRIGYRWVGGYLRWTIRVLAWFLLLSGTYPPFSLSGEEHPIRVRIEEGQPINRLWGIPILGYLVRAIVLIPHFIVLWVLAILVYLLLLVSWIPILIYGRQADLVYSIVGGYLRWTLRVWAYFALLDDRYPPFSLGEDDPAPVW
jgi:hypothetical protein